MVPEQPLSSIRLHPSLPLLATESTAHVDAPLAGAQSVRVEVNALGDAVEDGHLEVGVQLLLAREELIEERVHLRPLDARCDEFPARRRSPGHERSARAHLGLG
jgi:hypothetical protein